MIGAPEAFARTTVEREGEPGAAWLAELPHIVRERGGILAKSRLPGCRLVPQPGRGR
ncbi:hypothetical protein R1T08_39005 [Streptomyces sp. SBC-4]|nr:hypothetical protein [Streptomyces sp. SBC-4]MDV5149929.1 hypothetical protein [Streptomyces sp. SBC-4]